MKKPISFNISIPNPCQQDWENMERRGNGLHCTDCQKIVTDFTKMTDAGIIDFLQKGSFSCGVFRADQLDREITVPIIHRAPFGAKWLFGMLLFFGWMKEGAAQHKATSKTKTHQTLVAKKHSTVKVKDGTIEKEERSVVHTMPIIVNERVMGGVPPQSFPDLIVDDRRKVARPDSTLPNPNTVSRTAVVSERHPGVQERGYIIDGIILNPSQFEPVSPAKRKVWDRLRFWKKKK